MEEPGTPSTGGMVLVERLAPAKAHDAGDVLAASHADYPGFRHVFPDPIVRQRTLRVFMAATARDAALHMHALIALDADGVLGVALWSPPGTFPFSGGRKARMAPALIRIAFSAPASFRDFVRIGTALEKAHPVEPAWYLQALGVHPRAQRRGIGKLLMAPGLALADGSGLPCYLQTSDPANIDYYRRFGFDLVQPRIQVFRDGPAYLGMRRPPRPAVGTDQEGR
jgi:ribosomal protein S18 acetylase RimI-like enzyme